MLNENQITYIKAIKTKYISIIDDKTILGDNGDCGVFKVLHIRDSDLSINTFDNGIDFNAYKKSIKDKLVNNINIWSNKLIKNNHLQKLNRIENLKTMSTNTVFKELDDDHNFFYTVMKEYKTRDNGEFIDIFNDGNFIFMYPAMLKLRKKENVSVTRYTINDNKLYKFSLKDKKFVIDTYVLCIDI